MNHLISSSTLETIRAALLWSQQNLGKHTRPSPVDKALADLDQVSNILTPPASDLLEKIGDFPLDGSIQIFPDSEDLSQRNIARMAQELVDAGLASIRQVGSTEARIVTLINPPPTGCLPEVTQQLVNRRLWLCNHTPACPSCGASTQIQLKDWLITPAEWKCRTCKHTWTFDPPSEALPPLSTEGKETYREWTDAERLEHLTRARDLAQRALDQNAHLSAQEYLIASEEISNIATAPND